MRKRFLAVLLTLCMVFSLGPTAYAVPENGFTDVGTGDWFYDEVQYVHEKGLMQGTGDTTFSPQLTTSRGMIVSILYRLEGEPAVEGNCPFNDVAAGQYYEKAITWAAANKIVDGYDSSTFGPDDNITREQVAAIFYRYANYKGYDVTATIDISGFTDSNKISNYALTPMRWANATGLIDGKENNILDPGGSAKRCQVAAILYRFCEKLTNDKATEYTVSFLLNDGSTTVYKTETAADGKTVAQPAAPSRSGYSFLGWYTAASGGEKFDFKTVISANVTLYAQWTAASGGGGSGGGGGGGGGGGNTPAVIVATTALTITPMGESMNVGSSYPALTVTRDGNDALTWVSSDETIVKVDAKTGKLSALRTGNVTISAETASGIAGSTTVYVENPIDKTPGDNSFEYAITEPGTVMENASFTKLTIAASVGAGEVTLNNVTAGQLIVLGGGANSVKLNGGSYDKVDVNGASSGGTRLLTSGNVVVSEVNVGAVASNVILETEQGSSASIGEVKTDAPLEIKNSDIQRVTTSSNLTVTNGVVNDISTVGNSNTELTLTGSTVKNVVAGADSTSIGGDTAVLKLTASKNVTTNVPVGNIDASNGANVTANKNVSSLTGNAGDISLNNSGSTSVLADATSVTVAGQSKPVVSGTVQSINVTSDREGSSGVTVNGNTSTITTTGSGSVGEINIGSDASPTLNTGAAAVKIVSVSDEASPTITGTAQTIVSSSSGKVDASNATIDKVLATAGSVVQSKTEVQTVTTELQYIAVTSLPAKTEYMISDSALDTTGLVVTGYYTVSGFDGTVSKTLAGYTTSEWNAASGIHDITVSYTDGSTRSATFKVTVVAKVLSRIAVTKTPAQTTYDLANAPLSLNTAGIEIMAYYTSELYPAEKVTPAGYTECDLSTTGMKTVKANYDGKTVSFTVNVIDSAADAFALAKANANSEFLKYYSDVLVANTYSEAGKAAMKDVRDAGIDALDLKYKEVEISVIASTLTAEKAKVDAVPTQDEEWTAEANAYKDVHSAVLAKSTATVIISDKADVFAAMNDYSALTSGVQNKLTAERTKLNSLLTVIASLEADQTVDAAKTTALATLASAYAKYSSGYTSNKSGIDNAYSAGQGAIRSVTDTTAAVTAALDNAMTAMASFKSDAVLLGEAQTKAINDINGYLPLNATQETYNVDYNALGKAQVADERASGVTAINAANSAAAVAEALVSAKAKVDAVQTAVQMEAASLMAFKAAAKAELTAYGDREQYRAAGMSDFDSAKASGEAAIDSVIIETTLDAAKTAVTEALRNAKAAINTIKTDAQLSAAELIAARVDAKAALSEYKSQSDYSVAGWQLVQGKVSAWSTAIDACTTIGEVTSALNTAKEEIDAISITTDEKAENARIVAVARAAVTDAAYTAIQADVNTADAAKAAAEAAVAKLSLPAGVTATVIAGTSFTPAVAGDSGNPAGINGSYTFTVKLEAGKNVAGDSDTYVTDTTAQITMTITANVYTGASDVALVGIAKSAVEGATYGPAAQATYDTETKLADYVKGIAETAAGTGITVEITKVDYSAPVAGTIDKIAGTDGSYSFTVKLTKGTASDVTKTLSVTVTATAYTAQPSVAVTPAAVSISYMGGTTLTAAATDILNPSYKWYKSETVSGIGSEISGQTANTLVLSDLTETAYYYCMCNGTKSNVATVTVGAQGASATPVVTISGMETTYTLPHSAAITLSVAANDTYAYKWEFQNSGETTWNAIEDTDNTIEISSISFDLNGRQYRCTVTNTELNKSPAEASNTVTLNIQKGTQSAPAATTNYTVTQPAGIGGTGTLGYVTGIMQYSADGNTWSNFSADKTGLAVGTHYVRFTENDNYAESPVAEVSIVAYTVASIGDNKYESLAEAIGHATATDTVTLEKDIDLTSTVAVDKDLKINMNGKNITGKDCRAILVNGGTLTLEGAGTVSSTHSDGNTTFVNSSSVIRVSGDTSEAKLIVGRDVIISTDFCYGITLFGKTNKQMLDISGKVAVTGESPAISGNGQAGYTETEINIHDGAVVSATQNTGIYHPQAGMLTITGGEISGKSAVEAEAGTVNISGNATLTATDSNVSCLTANIDGAATTGYALAVVERNGYKGDVDATISGGTFTGTVGKAVSSTNAEKTYKISIIEGSFSVDPSEYVSIASKVSGTNPYVVSKRSAEEAVASIGNMYYESLAEAIGHATATDTVTLEKDINLTLTVAVDKDLKINMNGKNITGKDCRAILVNGGTLTLEGAGTISSTHSDGNTTFVNSSSVIRVSGDTSEAKLIVGSDVIISTDFCYGITLFGKTNKQMLDISGKVAVTGESPAISGNGQAGYTETGINIHDGAVVSATQNTGIYHPQAGMLTITGGEISGKSAVEAEAGTVNISGNATLTATDSNVSCLTANIDGAATTGYALAVVERNGYKGDVDATISGGTFTGTVGKAVSSTNAEKTYKISIIEGSFSVDPSEYVSSASKVSGTNPYVVSKRSAEEAVASIGNMYYESLDAAIDAVTSGQTVTLLKNVENGNGVIVPSGKDFTLDFDGNTYTVDNSFAGSSGTKTQCFQLLEGSTLTFENGTIEANAVGLKVIIQNYADLTLSNMTLDATAGTNNIGMVLSINNGEVNVLGDTSITAKDGKSAIEMSWWPGSYPDGAQVTLDTTGTITGDIEVGLYGNGSTIATPVLSALQIDNVQHNGAIKTYNATDSTYGTGLNETEAAAAFAEMLSIIGGTFSTDPSDYVADGHTVENDGEANTWTVVVEE